MCASVWVCPRTFGHFFVARDLVLLGGRLVILSRRRLAFLLPALGLALG
jgi:hypothetical protein